MNLNNMGTGKRLRDIVLKNNENFSKQWTKDQINKSLIPTKNVNKTGNNERQPNQKG